jgi:hypothetical protein
MAKWKGWPILFRTVIMVWCSEAFLHNSWRRVSQLPEGGLAVTNWSYAQLSIWTTALLVWLWMGWFDLRRFAAPGRENR